jgi:16S rRNA (guanine527-N7)-methyltransferase
MNQVETEFFDQLKLLGLRLSDAQTVRLLTFLELLLAANQATNLTAISAYAEALYKHLYDALSIQSLPEFARAVLICDIGSGAGIPGLPLAICFPEKQFFSIEATHKKVLFQETASHQLGLANFRPIWARAEERILPARGTAGRPSI